MPPDPGQISFIPVELKHVSLLRQWLEQPHMQEWWGDPDEELGFIRDMVDGKDTTRPFLFASNENPLGYIQYWFVGHHQNEQWTRDHPWLLDLPSDSVGVDISIGCPDKLSQGFGSAALAAFANRLREEGYRNIIIDPDPENHRAVRAYIKAGFKPIPHLHGRTGDVLLMQHHSEVAVTE